MELVIIRGLPGSGKSTLARSMQGYKHFEADMFFMRGEKYCYDPTRIKEAHHWCQKSVKSALNRGHDVVVSNAFSRRHEFAPYLEMAEQFKATVRIIVAKGNWPNVHNVPEEAIQRMRERWEE